MEQNYFEIKAISNSDLKHFKRSPEHYKQYKKDGSADTEATIFGSAFHSYILEPHKFESEFVIMDESNRPVPEKDYRTTANKEWKESFYLNASSKNLKVLSVDDFERLKLMKDKLYSVAPAKEILEFTRNEYEKTLRWNYKGIACKGKADIINDFFIADLKTTEDADPVEFSKTVIWNEYYRQAGMYLDGDSAGHINYSNLKSFYFIAIEKKPPFGVSVHVCSKDLIEKGVEEYRFLVEQLKSCIDADKWESYHFKALSRMDGIFELDLPLFMKN